MPLARILDRTDLILMVDIGHHRVLSLLEFHQLNRNLRSIQKALPCVSVTWQLTGL